MIQAFGSARGAKMQLEQFEWQLFMLFGSGGSLGDDACLPGLKCTHNQKGRCSKRFHKTK